MNSFCEVFNLLLIENKITAYKLWKSTNIPQSVIGKWKKGEQAPNAESLQKVASFFNVSIDYLLGNTEIKNNPTTLKDDEVEKLLKEPYVTEILSTLKKLSPERQKVALVQLQALADLADLEGKKDK